MGTNNIPADEIARTLAEQVRNVFQHLDLVFGSGTNVFWASPTSTPQEIADALGTKAADFLAFYEKLGSFLDSVKSADHPRATAIGKYTTHADGTVKIVAAPAAPATNQENSLL